MGNVIQRGRPVELSGRRNIGGECSVGSAQGKCLYSLRRVTPSEFSIADSRIDSTLLMDLQYLVVFICCILLFSIFAVRVFNKIQFSSVQFSKSIQFSRTYRKTRMMGLSDSVTLARLSISSSLQITNRSFRYASPYLWNQLPSSFRQHHFVHSPPDSPHPAHITSSQSSSNLLSPSITSLVLHSRLKTHFFHRSFPPQSSYSYSQPRSTHILRHLSLSHQLPSSFRQSHCVHSPPGSPHPTHITSSQSSPLFSPSVTPSTFHSRLKTHLFHKSFPPQSLLFLPD